MSGQLVTSNGLVAELQFDVTQGTFSFQLDQRCRSIVFRFDPDQNGNLSGSVAIFLNGATGGLPWQTVTPTNVPISRPAPATRGNAAQVILKPAAGSNGILTVTMTQDVQGVR